MTNKLLPVLLRFRQHSLAIQSDIEAMYNQVRIPDYDRDALRFFWVNDGKITHYRMTSHLFGGKWCAASSTYALRRTIHDNQDIDPLVRETIERDFYVDDCLKSCIHKGQARTVIHETPKVLQEGGFNLTKFVVNDSELLSEISEEHRAKEARDFTPDMPGKVLGIKWNISADAFYFDVQIS